MWDSIRDTLAAEFSDLADPGDLTSFLVRIVLAAALSAVVGYDRERRGSTAGVGREASAIAATALVFVILTVLLRLERKSS